MSEEPFDSGIPDLPDWMEEKLDDPDDRKSIRNRHILKHFLDKMEIRGWLRVWHLEDEFDVSNEQLRKHLTTLVDRGLLDKRSVGDGNPTLYWVNHSETDWPLPPDAEVEISTDEMTIASLRTEWWFLFGFGAISLSLAGSSLITIAISIVFLGIQLPGIAILGTSFDIPGGLLILGILASAGAVVLAIVTGVLSARSPSSREAVHSLLDL